MNWKSLFSPTRDLRPDEAREFMASRKSGEYQLVDVRQPREYEAGHLAGARLIPVKELPDHLASLVRDKPVLVYCAVGGRSKAAAQYLAGRDFVAVYNLSGGIKAWQGRQALGQVEAGLELFAPAGDYEDAFSLAFAMEDGLGKLYLALAEKSGSGEAGLLYRKLAGFEEGHKARLLAGYRKAHGDEETLPARPEAEVMEGGVGVAEALAGLGPVPEEPEMILDLAMGLETQALDFYGRLAQKSEQAEAREFFLALADEEKGHLALLARIMDDKRQSLTK